MEALLKRSWWALLLGGIALIIFGGFAFFWPGKTLLFIATFFAATVLVDGVITAISAIRNRGLSGQWWLWLLMGILGIVAGAIGLRQPEVAAGALLLLISAYAIAIGVLTIWAGFRLRKEISNEWLLWLLGAISVVFGVLMITQPAAGLLGLVWAIASWAVAIGILKIMLAFKARNFRERLQQSAAPARA